MDIGFDQDVYSSNAIQCYLFVLVIPPVTHFGKVRATSLVFLVALCKDCVLV